MGSGSAAGAAGELLGGRRRGGERLRRRGGERLRSSRRRGERLRSRRRGERERLRDGRRRLRDESLDEDELEELELELEDDGERRPMLQAQISINASNATSQTNFGGRLLVSYWR